MYVTDSDKYCIICGKPRTDMHHCEFGWANRKLADEDGLIIPLCRGHHEMIHNYGECTYFSKLIGQLLWELNENATEEEIKETRERFRGRYGKSFI